MDYSIEISLDILELEEIIRGYIKKGWEPLGGVSAYTNVAGGVTYIQALIKK